MMDVNRLRQLVDDHAGALMLYARQWCAAPEDVVQEAFVKLVRQHPAPDAPVPWLYQVVRRRAISEGRSEQRRRRHEAVAAAGAPGWFVPREDSQLDAAEVARGLEKLPAEPREVITLHLWGGFTFGEIGVIMDCSASTAHRWYTAGLQQLRERLSSCPSRTDER